MDDYKVSFEELYSIRKEKIAFSFAFGLYDKTDHYEPDTANGTP